MKNLFLAITSLFITVLSFGQLETTTINGKNYYIYPFQESVNDQSMYYFFFAERKEVIQRDEKNQKIVAVTEEKISEEEYPDFMPFDSKKPSKAMVKSMETDPNYMASVRFSIDKEITPCLEPIPDGDYVVYYRDVPYIKEKVVRYRNNIVAALVHIKNNQLDGEANWYHLDGKLMKHGTYTDGLKTGVWKGYEYETDYESAIKLYEGKSKAEMRELSDVDFPVDTFKIILNYKNGISVGAYERYRGSTLLESGQYQDDKPSGTWKTFVFKEIKKVDEHSVISYEQTKEYFQRSICTYRSDTSRGKSIIIRDMVVPEYLLYEGSEGFHFYDSLAEPDESVYFPDFSSFYKILKEEENFELPEEEISIYEENDVNMEEMYFDEYMNDEWDPENEKEIYQVINNKGYTRNELIDSIGYQFLYEGLVENFYPNGQLQYRFEVKNGQLVAETPFYYDNGQIANEITFLADSNQYIERIYDYYGKLFSESYFDSIGNRLQKTEPEEEDVTFLNGKKYYLSIGDPTFKHSNLKPLKTGVTEKMLIEEERYKIDTSLASITYFDPIERTLSITRYNLPQKVCHTEETQFSEDYQTLNSNMTFSYKNIVLKGVVSGNYEKSGMRFLYPVEKKDSVNPQYKAVMWGQYYDRESDYTLYVNDQPFTGKALYRSNTGGFKLEVKDNTLNYNTPTGKKDAELYKKYVNTYLKTGKTNDIVEAYTPDFNRQRMITLSPSLMLGYNLNTERFDNNNYDLDKKLLQESEEMSYHPEFDNYGERDNKKQQKVNLKAEKIMASKFKDSYRVKATGAFKNGKQEGEWKEYDNFGKMVRVGNFINGELDGEYVRYALQQPAPKFSAREKRIISKSRFEYSLEELLENQELMPKKPTYYLKTHVVFSKGKVQGPVVEYNWLGDTLTFENYKDGLKNGLSYERNELFYSEEHFEDDVRDGFSRTYLIKPSNDSILLYDLNFQNGMLQGQSVAYHTNGKIAKKGFFLNGQPIDDYEAYDTLGFKYQYVKFLYNQPIEEKIWEENQLSVRYEFNWKDSVNFDISDLTESTSIGRLMSEMGYRNEEYAQPYYGRPSVLNKNGIDYTMTKYYPNDTVARHGNISKGKKVGCWTYFSYDGTQLMEVDYFDSIISLKDSIKFKSKGVLTYLDKNGYELSKSYIIEKFEKYDCAHTDHNEERMLYCFWEKDTAQHRINGYVKNYYDNGSIQNEGWVKDGLPTGIWKMYDVDGHLSHVGEYVMGKRNGRWLKGDLGNVKNMSTICLNPNLENLDEILKYQEKLIDISVIYYGMGKELRKEYYGINMNNGEAPEGYEGDYYEGEGF